MSFSCNVSHADTFHPHLMMCTNMTTILSHQEDLGPSMLNVKYEGLGGTGLVTTPLNMAPNLSECNVSHGGIARQLVISSNSYKCDHVMLAIALPVCGLCNIIFTDLNFERENSFIN